MHTCDCACVLHLCQSFDLYGMFVAFVVAIAMCMFLSDYRSIVLDLYYTVRKMHVSVNLS